MEVRRNSVFKVNFALVNGANAEQSPEHSTMSAMLNGAGQKPSSPGASQAGFGNKLLLPNQPKGNLERSFKPKFSKKSLGVLGSKKKPTQQSKPQSQGGTKEPFLPIIEFACSGGLPKFGWQVVLDHILNEQRPIVKDIDYEKMLSSKIDLENLQMVSNTSHHERVQQMEHQIKQKLERLQEGSIEVHQAGRSVSYIRKQRPK